jgi:hypothetical protein
MSVVRGRLRNMALPDRRQLLGERIARHGLAGAGAASVLDAVRRTTAVQAQDNLASRLGMRVRAAAHTDADVEAAIVLDRSIVRTWLLRGTIHLVAAADLRWLLRLVGPGVLRTFRARWERLGLTDELLDAYLETVAALVAPGPLTRAEIRAGLAEAGLRLPERDPQVDAHAIVHASCLGVLCRGPDRGRHSTFVRLEEWLPGGAEGPSGDDALAELARRYFAAYSPATSADFTTWSGLPGRRAVELIREELTPADVDGRPGYRLGEVEPARGLVLLPAFDNYLLGYRDRAAIVAPEHHGRVYQGGWIKPVVLLDGRAIGAWRLDRPSGTVSVEPFEAWSAAVRRRVAAEVADIGRFLGREVRLAG